MYCVLPYEQGYTTTTPLRLVVQDNLLLATHLDGKPLMPERYSLRAVIGSIGDRREEGTAYSWKGGKRLRGLEFRADIQRGFWQKAGYRKYAETSKEQRFGR